MQKITLALAALCLTPANLMAQEQPMDTSHAEATPLGDRALDVVALLKGEMAP